MKKDIISAILFYAIFFIHISHADTAEQVDNQSINNQADAQVHIYNQPDPTNCTLFHGEKLLDCMECQSPKNLKLNFANLNSRARAYYLNNILKIYRLELLNYYTDQEWEEFYTSLDPEEQHNFAATLEEEKKKHTPEEKKQRHLLVDAAFQLICMLIGSL